MNCLDTVYIHECFNEARLLHLKPVFVYDMLNPSGLFSMFSKPLLVVLLALWFAISVAGVSTYTLHMCTNWSPCLRDI